MSASDRFNIVNLENIGNQYRLENNELPQHVLTSSVVENIRQELTDNHRYLLAIAPLHPQTDKQTSLFIRKVNTFLNSPNYEGALNYLQDDYFEFEDYLNFPWNIPYSSRIIPHQMPGAPQRPLASPFLFPSEVELTEEGIRIKVFTSGFAKCQRGRNDFTDIRVESSDNLIRLCAMREEAELDCSQQSYVGREVRRTYHLPEPIVSQQLSCHYYSDTSVLIIQAPWLL